MEFRAVIVVPISRISFLFIETSNEILHSYFLRYNKPKEDG